jgi:putative copper export protein
VSHRQLAALDAAIKAKNEGALLEAYGALTNACNGCLLTIASTTLAQAWQWIGSVAGTEYGRIALAKLGVFLLLLILACVNRFVPTERLRDPVQPLT